MKITPCNDHVAVEILPGPAKTDSGIHIPESTQQTRDLVFRAKVIAVGPGRPITRTKLSPVPLHDRAPVSVEVDDVVLISRREGYTTLRDRDPEIRLYREGQLLGVELPGEPGDELPY